jgi:hypothetical protein
MLKNFLHYFKFKFGLEKPQTQTTELERIEISKFASSSRIAVEIGVFEGVNTCTIASSIDKNGILYGIDPFTKGRLGLCYGKLITLLNLRRNKLINKVKLIDKLSFDATNDVPNEIDFIFIDGDHSFDGFKKDWIDWSRKVKIGGIVALHDTEIPKHDLTVSNLGCFKYYKEFITKDSRYLHLKTIDSLNVLKRIC